MTITTLQGIMTNLLADVHYTYSVLEDVRCLGGLVEEAAEANHSIAYARFDLALAYATRMAGSRDAALKG